MRYKEVWQWLHSTSVDIITVMRYKEVWQWLHSTSVDIITMMRYKEVLDSLHIQRISKQHNRWHRLHVITEQIVTQINYTTLIDDVFGSRSKAETVHIYNNTAHLDTSSRLEPWGYQRVGACPRMPWWCWHWVWRNSSQGSSSKRSGTRWLKQNNSKYRNWRVFLTAIDII